MENILFLKATRALTNIIKKEVSVDQTIPYAFEIANTQAFSRIAKWAVANGAAVEVLKQGEKNLLVEITDPVAASLESYLKGCV